jgi:SOS-response transcriptional repressor LexA
METETIGNKIKQLREAQGLSQSKLSKLSGVDRSSLNKLESGKRTTISWRVARSLSPLLGVTPEALIGESPLPEPKPKSLQAILSEAQEAMKAMELVQVPVLGTVPAGHFNLEEQQTEGYVPIPRSLLGASGKNLYVLNVSGESLAGDNIHSGDQVVVEPAAAVVDGKIYIVRINSEVTAKHVYRLDGKVKLVSTNGEYKEMVVDDVEILGRVILSGRWRKQ